MLVQRKYGDIELGAGLFVYNQCSANVPGDRLCVYAPVLSDMFAGRLFFPRGDSFSP